MIWCCLSDAVLKLAYAQLKFPQIADTQGYAVAEAFLQIGSSNDDGSAKQLDLAIKLAEKEFDRKAKRGRAEYGPGGGYGWPWWWPWWQGWLCWWQARLRRRVRRQLARL